MLQAARDYLGRGYQPLPIPRGQKGPKLPDWPNLRFGLDRVSEYFPDGEELNIGIILGSASGNLVDIDCDCDEAAQAADLWLPPTAIFGRAARPMAHRLYVCDELPASERLRDENRQVIVEIRAEGCQTVFPPSIHPTGERYEWLHDVPPVRIPRDVLLRGVQGTLGTVLLARWWPEKGSRHDLANALAGAMQRAGWGPAQVERFMALVVRLAHDPEAEERVATALDTLRRKDHDKGITGRKTVMRLLGDRPARRVFDAVGLTIRQVASVNLVVSFPRGDDGVDEKPNPGTEKSTPPLGGLAEEINGLDGGVDGDDPEVFRPTIRKLGTFVETEVQWLWKNYLAVGTVMVLDGDPGLGKSQITLDLAARVTRGLLMPGGASNGVGEPGTVILLNAEDGYAHTVLPRARVAGADTMRIELLTLENGHGDEAPFELPENITKLEATVKATGAKLIIIDPLMAFLGAGIDSYKDQSIRRALSRLARLADRLQVAIVVVRHLTKDEDKRAIARGGGSMGIIGQARTGFIVAEHPADHTQKVMACTKNNLGPEAPSWCYRIIEVEPGRTRVEWGETTTLRANDLFEKPEKENPAEAHATQQAIHLITAVLGQGGYALSRTLEAERKLANVSEKTLERARAKVELQVRRFHKDWYVMAKARAEAYDAGAWYPSSDSVNSAIPLVESPNGNGHLRQVTELISPAPEPNNVNSVNSAGERNDQVDTCHLTDTGEDEGWKRVGDR